MESFVGRGDCWAFDASDWIGHTAYKFGNLHSYACSCIGITLRNKKQAFRSHLQTSYLGSWRYFPHVSLLFTDFVSSPLCFSPQK